MDEKRTKAQLTEEVNSLRQEARLLYSVTQVAATTESFEEALQRCLDIVCEYIMWPVGHLYVPDLSGDGVLAPTSVWHLADPKAFQAFRQVTEQTRFAPGVGLPGRVWSSGEPSWIVDVQKDDNFPRNRIGEAIGVRGAFAIPPAITPATARKK